MKIEIGVNVPDDELADFLALLKRMFLGIAVVEAPAASEETVDAPKSRKKGKSPAADETSAAASEGPTETVPAVSMEDVLKKAEAFLKTEKDGPGRMSKILKKIGASRVREIPAEKLPEFLSLLAVE